MAFFWACAGVVRAAPWQRAGRLIVARNYAKSGLYTMKKALAGLGARAIDQGTQLGRALAAWRADLVRELGGAAVTAQQLTVINIAANTKILLDSIDAWLVSQPTLIKRRHRALIPVVTQRQQLADALVRYMTALGLDRREAEAPSLQTYIATKYGQQPPAAPHPAQPAAPPRAPTGATTGWSRGKCLAHFSLTHSYQHVGEIEVPASLQGTDAFGL
jgi:hypothetical protein